MERASTGALGRGGIEPLSPQRKWRAITVATVLLAPAFWAVLSALVASASDQADAPDPAAALALGFALIPFVFIALAFMSQHPRAPIAVVKAMGLTLLVGLPVTAIAGDGVTGIVAGIGAGGIVALRSDAPHRWQTRTVAVLIGTIYAFILVRVGGTIGLLPAPILPFTAIGLADHFDERRETQAGT